MLRYPSSASPESSRRSSEVVQMQSQILVAKKNHGSALQVTLLGSPKDQKLQLWWNDLASDLFFAKWPACVGLNFPLVSSSVAVLWGLDCDCRFFMHVKACQENVVEGSGVSRTRSLSMWKGPLACPYAPWCWKSYQHFPHKWPSHVD